MTERQNKILEVLAVSQKIEVTALAEILEVSQVTVRKDLDQLEESGFIRREHGYALFGSINDVGRRMAIQYDVKQRIAKAAADLVEDGETVMIESGSCCALLAEQLANSKKNITIITNSVFIANHVRNASNIRIILLGGEYQGGTQVTVGSITRRNAEVFFSDKFFIGADGFTGQSFTGSDHFRAQTVRDLAEHAREIIVLTESEKFNRRGLEETVRLDQVDSVITDDRIHTGAETVIRDKDVKITKVPSTDASSAALHVRLLSPIEKRPRGRKPPNQGMALL
jgi:DeoR/GlpR family transcriptional regulator of sugar metabolism